MYYNLSNNIRIIFLKFFQTLFAQYKEGKVSFVDGTNKIEFKIPPKCLERDTFDYKQFPALLIGVGPVAFKDVHFNKYVGITSDTAPQKIYGGEASLTMTLKVYALNKEDRNNIADLVGMYLAKRDTKEAFINTYGIRLGNPSWGGDGVEEETQTNMPRFFTEISMPMFADYRDEVQIVDSQGRPGLTVQNIVSLVAEQMGSGEIVGY